MHIKWNLRISDQGLLQIHAHINKHQIYVNFQTPPTFVKIVEDVDTKTKLIIYSDGQLTTHYTKDSSLNQAFMYVPDGYRYGTYYVQGNNVLYKKDFWNYNSVGYYNSKKPILRNVSPRKNVLYQIVCDFKSEKA